MIEEQLFFFIFPIGNKRCISEFGVRRKKGVGGWVDERGGEGWGESGAGWDQQIYTIL